MNSLLQKGAACLLAMLLAVGTLCACSGSKPQETPSDTEPSTDAGSTEDLYDSNGYLKDSLPERYDFNEDFVIYTWSEMKSWEWVEKDDDSASTVAQALVTRQQRVEDRFNITIKLRVEAGNWGNRTQFISTLSNSVQVNDQAFDLVGQYTPAAGLGAIQGLYMDLYELPWLDLEKPWWPASISETCTVGEKLYQVTGDITPTLIRNVHCMFLNTDLFDSYELSEHTGENRSIYDVVIDGDWTLEMMQTLGLNQVGSMDGVEESNRVYGISFLNNVAADAFYFGGGFTMLENRNGVLSLSNDLTSGQLSDWYDAVQKLFTGYYADAGIFGSSVFKTNRAIFYAGSVADSQTFTEEGVHFTLLPQPKLNTDQTDYYTVSSFWVTMYSVPSDARSTTLSGMVLEGLASESYRSLKDEIYYNIFQFRYNADSGSQSAKMFDIVSNSVVFDTSRFFADELAMFASFRNGVTDSASGSWSSVYGGNNETWGTKLDGIYGKLG